MKISISEMTGAQRYFYGQGTHLVSLCTKHRQCYIPTSEEKAHAICTVLKKMEKDGCSFDDMVDVVRGEVL